MFDKSTVQIERFKYDFLPELFLSILFLGIIFIAYTITPFFGGYVILWGYKDVAVFDIWTIEHIASGMGIAYFSISCRNFEFFERKPLQSPILLLLVISGSWEITEHYLEVRSLPAIMQWFAGEEHYINRFLSDQFSILFGFTLIKAFPNLIVYARLFSICFVGLHVWLGSSMYFH